MICSRFERWLDEGRPDGDREAAERHAAGCPDCAARLHAMDEIEDLLGSRFAVAPPAFADRVLASLPPRAFRPVAPEPEETFPWWVRLFQEPLTAASMIAAGGFLIVLPELTGAARSGLPALQRVVEHGAVGLDRVLGPIPTPPLPVPPIAVTLLAALAVTVAAAELGRAVARRVSGSS